MTVNLTVPSALASMFTSWKSSLVGLAGILLAAYQASKAPDIMTALHSPSFQTLVVLGILGFIAKDNNVTGGTVGATEEARKRLNVTPLIVLVALLSLGMATPARAQGLVYGKLTVSQPAITKRLAGKSAKSILLGSLNVCATTPIQVADTDIKIHVSGVDFLSESDAVSIITSSYNSQTPQKIANGATLGAGAIGVAVGLRSAVASLPVIGWILGGVSFAQTTLVPMLESNQTPLSTIIGNQLINMGTSGIVTVGPQNCIQNARVFVSSGGRKMLLPLVQNFSFTPGTAPNTPTAHAEVRIDRPLPEFHEPISVSPETAAARLEKIRTMHAVDAYHADGTYSLPAVPTTAVQYAYVPPAPPPVTAEVVHVEPVPAANTELQQIQKDLAALQARINQFISKQK